MLNVNKLEQNKETCKTIRDKHLSVALYKTEDERKGKKK